MYHRKRKDSRQKVMSDRSCFIRCSALVIGLTNPPQPFLDDVFFLFSQNTTLDNRTPVQAAHAKRRAPLRLLSAAQFGVSQTRLY